jgi:hypothetical protein
MMAETTAELAERIERLEPLIEATMPPERKAGREAFEDCPGVTAAAGLLGQRPGNAQAIGLAHRRAGTHIKQVGVGPVRLGRKRRKCAATGSSR